MPSDPITPETPPAEEAASKAKKPAAKAEKAPAKPFPDLIQEDLIPATQAAFSKRGTTDLKLRLEGKTLVGSFDNDRRLFSILFAEETTEGSKFFAHAIEGDRASTVESFMIDERKPNIDLIVFYIVQRLFAQQWI